MKLLGVFPKIKEAMAMGDRPFIIKVALFNSLCFSLIVGWVTFVDARLTTHVAFGARYYRGGHAVSFIGGLSVLVFTFFFLPRVVSWKLKATLPTIILVVALAAALPFFRPEFPHGGMTTWTLFLCLVSLVSCWIKYSPTPANWLADEDLSATIKMERIKEYANIWRTVAISITIGYIAVLIPWTSFVWNQSAFFVVDPSERILLSQFGSGLLIALSIYVLLGVVYEAFSKANDAANLMLGIRKPR